MKGLPRGGTVGLVLAASVLLLLTVPCLVLVTVRALRPSPDLPFIQALGDPEVWEAVWLTGRFAGSTVSIQIVLGCLLGIFVARQGRLRTLLASALAIPLLLSPIAVSLISRFVLDPTLSPLSSGVRTILLIPAGGFSTSESALRSIIWVHSWQWTPLVALLVFSALRSLWTGETQLPRLDGLRRWGHFRWIVLPRLGPALIIGALLGVLEAIRLFDLVQGTTRGGPGTATETLGYLVYERSFQYLGLPQPYSPNGVTLVLWLLSLGVLFTFTTATGLLGPEVGIEKGTRRR